MATATIVTRSTRTGIGLAIALAAIMVTPARASSAVMSKADLLAAAEANRAAIHDLTVSFSFDLTAPSPAPANLVSRWHQEVTIKGEKYVVKEQMRFGEAANRAPGERWTAWNGERFTLCNTTPDPGLRLATVNAERLDRHGTHGRGFFDVNLLNYYTAAQEAEGYGEMNLVSVLRSPDSRVRDNLEPIDGHPCQVIDVVDESTGLVRRTIWLDAERGLVPMRQVFNVGPDFTRPLLEFEVISVTEATPGLWFVDQAAKRFYPIPGDMPETAFFQESVLVVDVNPDTGASLISVNTGLEDEVFDLWNHLPIGTRVSDKTTGRSWTVAAADFHAIGADALATAKAAGLKPALASSSPSLKASAENQHYTQPTWIILMMLSVGLVFRLARR